MKMLTKDGHKTPAHDTLSAVSNHPNDKGYVPEWNSGEYQRLQTLAANGLVKIKLGPQGGTRWIVTTQGQEKLSEANNG